VTTGPLGTSIGRRAAGGGIWVLGGTVAGGLATTVVMLILAGLLTPAEFGAVAIAVVILEAATVGLSPGLGQAVQSIGRSREVEATALAIALLAGSGVALILAPLVPALVWLFGVPEAAPLAAAILIALPPRRWNEVRLAQFERELEFRVPNLVVGVAALVAGAVAVVAAVVGMGAWALLVQVVGTEVLTAVGLTVTGPRPVRPELHRRAAPSCGASAGSSSGAPSLSSATRTSTTSSWHVSVAQVPWAHTALLTGSRTSPYWSSPDPSSGCSFPSCGD
jgi:O-antigen/teichoic acid export membrane protein